MRSCTICGHPIVLVPSAADRIREILSEEHDRVVSVIRALAYRGVRDVFKQ